MPTSSPVRVHLGRDARRVVLLVHLATSLGWLGADVVLGVLAVTGFVSDDPALVAACYTALHVFAVPVLLALGLGSLGSGLLLGLASRWGVVRTTWVLVKLVINLVLVALVPVLLQPRLAEVAREARQVDPGLVERLGADPAGPAVPRRRVRHGPAGRRGPRHLEAVGADPPALTAARRSPTADHRPPTADRRPP
jgi:hypothetical protein